MKQKLWLDSTRPVLAISSVATLKALEESEPARLEVRAKNWERMARVPGANLKWLMDLAVMARQTASNIRAMRSARMRVAERLRG